MPGQIPKRVSPGRTSTGVTSICEAGEAALTGAVTLSEGANITLTQAAQNISIAAAGGGGGDYDLIYQDNTTHTSTGVHAEETLCTYTVIGGTIGATGGIRVLSAGKFTGGAGTKDLRLYFGGTQLFGVSFGAASAYEWRLECEFYNTDAANQRSIAFFLWTNGNQYVDYTTAAINTANNAIILLTATPAGAGDTIINYMFNVTKITGV